MSYFFSMSFFTSAAEKFQETMLDDKHYRYITDGLANTLIITLGAVCIGIIIGTLVAVEKVSSSQSKHPVARFFRKVLDVICSLYLTVIRGTPMLLQLMIMYFIILSSCSNGILVAIIAFGINSGAYVAEVVRGGIQSVDKGQMEAGRSLGLDMRTTMIKIIFPQALKNVLPALGNEFIALLKETSVAGYIGIHDLTKGADIIRSVTYDPFTPLISAGVVYLVIVVIITYMLSRLERRLHKSDIR